MPLMCAYYSCQRRKKENPMMKTFKFPVQDSERLQRWILNSGNARLLTLEVDQLKNQFLCDVHFSDDSFVDPKSKHRLTKFAIPEPYYNEENAASSSQTRVGNASPPILKVKIPQKVYSKKRSRCSPALLETSSLSQSQNIDEICQMPLIPPGDSPRTKKIKQDIAIKNKIIRNKRNQIRTLREKNRLQKQHLTAEYFLRSYNFPSQHSKAVASMQFKTKRRSWTADEQKFALTLYFKSPAAYKFLLRQKVILPSITSIKRWLGASKFMPGVNSRLFHEIKTKFSLRPEKDKFCVLCFDEMSIMECLEFSKEMDVVEGYEDYGSLGRSNLTAKNALVFMARGIHSHWKLPLAYFLSHSGVKVHYLIILIKSILSKLFDCGLIPKFIVCDQGSSNQSLVKHLNITPDCPFLIHRKRKIFFLYDTPHLFKSFRNNLLNSDFVLDNKIISFNDIKNTYNIDQKNKKSRALTKITDAHISPNNFQKMSVKLAVQVFSKTMVAAIRTCADTGELKSESAKDTANFLEFMDKLFDSLNSKNLYTSNPYRCGLSEESNLILSTLDEAKIMLKSLKKIDHIKGTLTRPPCFNGLLQTIEGILQFFNEEGGYILTNRLNQDALENLFSTFRQKGGYNRNPSARTLRTIFRSCAINSLMTPPSTSSCEPDTDEILDVQSFTPGKMLLESDSSATSSSLDSPESTTIIEPSSHDPLTLEHCSITYFAGYLAKKCLETYNCSICNNSFTTSSLLEDTNELFILHKTYANISLKDVDRGLTKPTNTFVEIVNLALTVFETHFSSICCKKRLRERFLRKITAVGQISVWINENSMCSSHRLFIIEKLIICKIFKNCKLTFKKTSPEKQHPKLRILDNK